MKRILIIITCVALVVQSWAQFQKDEWGDIVPYSLTKEYKELINSDALQSLKYPSFNNDSLCRANNNGKSFNELGNVFAAGFIIDSLIFFKEKAKLFDIAEGTLWLLSIESPTATSFSFYIRDFDVPEGCYFAVIPGFMPYEIDEPEVYVHEEISQRIHDTGLHGSVENYRMILEYFEPKGITKGSDFLIERLVYKYAGGFGQILKKSKKENSTNSGLKSGIYEDPNDPPLPCQYDTECADVAAWSSEKKSVCHIRIDFLYNNTNYVSSGTGFFINKNGNYSSTDQPLVVSCGHIFAPEVAPNVRYDISSNHGRIQTIIDYEHESCNESKVRYGKTVKGSMNRIYLGNDFNPALSGYRANEDYSIFQTNRTTDRLARYDILYAGWDSNPNYLDEGYAAIGHPKNSVKMINVENSRAWANADGFGLYFDKGVNEHGCSGSPVFNNTKKVVGWVCRGGGDCTTVGQNIPVNRSTCGKLNHIHFLLSPYIDPNNSGSSSSSNPQLPSPQDLPSHCDNCTQDGDETGVDCGGSCYPCGMEDVMTLKTDLDLIGNVKSRYEIFAEPDPGTLLALKSGISSLEAGLNIYLNGGFEVHEGATFYAGIDTELMAEADRGCQSACVSLANVFTPNGDGTNDYWGFRQTFVEKYSIEVFNSWQQKVYSAYNQPVYSNGVIFAWDASGATSSGVYKVIISYTDCMGVTRSEDQDVHVLGLKSVETIVPEIEENNEIFTDVSETIKGKPLIQVYPNPFNDLVSVKYSGDSFPIHYQITDLNGKVVKRNQLKSSSEQINLSHYPPGAYIINARAGDCNLVQKLIKK